MCGSKPQTATYTHNMQARSIPVKDVNTISKWTRGALARRRFRKLVLTKEIAGKYNQLIILQESEVLMGCLDLIRFEIPSL